MITEYTGRHIDITPALRTHAEEQLDKTAHVFDGKATKAHVIMEVERGRHRAEVIVNWRTEVLNASATSADMYQSISQAVSKIEKQALKVKKKVIDKSHRARPASSVAGDGAAVLPEPTEKRIIVSNGYEVKPVTVEEATMLLDGREENFVVFRNADHQGISVLFKRKDGNYGLIEP